MPPNQKCNLPDLMDSIMSDFTINDDGVADPISSLLPTSNATLSSSATSNTKNENNDQSVFRCAILGCGMMGQEHISYIMGYKNAIKIDYLCDPFEPSLKKSVKIIEEFSHITNNDATDSDHDLRKLPILLRDEAELLKHASEIDLLVIATPNYLHTDSLIKWANHDITILVEKPVAVSYEQNQRLRQQFMSKDNNSKARIWVAMEYRYIPAIAKLVSLLPTVGDIKMITIRENRYPFLHKIGKWNRDKTKTGDTFVEKCCHFFDLFRLISGQEIDLSQMRAMAQRGLNYQDEQLEQMHESDSGTPIIDSAYVIMPFEKCKNNSETDKNSKVKTMGCLELCMYAEGSRHQEEVIVTGTKGRLEAYLPENKVYSFERPSFELWRDRSIPPPPNAIRQTVYDCSSVHDVHGIDNDIHIPTHGGYHYSSTGVEWYRLLTAMKKCDNIDSDNGTESGDNIRGFIPEVSLDDGLRAIEIGLQATSAIVNESTHTASPKTTIDTNSTCCNNAIIL